jgi:beta-N-acetylhexosaminidase
MSHTEKIGQLLMVGFPGKTATPEILTLIREHHIGGIVLFARNLSTPQQIQELTQSLQQAACEAGHRYPLLISVDQENGLVRRFGNSATIFPGNMALGAIDGPDATAITQRIARATGEELRAMGINMNLAPVADVNNNPANPVIGVRSFGEDPQRVGQLVAAMVHGYREAGIITSLKHFPGHGDTTIDSHLGLPSLPFDHQRLSELELIPFQQGITAGADSIMVGHLALPALVPDTPTYPATVSPQIIRELLRTEMGYQGVVITDCLEMNAIAETLGVAAGAVMAIQAGADIVLVSHCYDRQLASLEAIHNAIEQGQLDSTTIDKAVERILCLKARMLSWDSLPDTAALQIVNSPEHARLSASAYERSTTVVRDLNQQLPLHLQPEQRLLIVQPPHPQHTLAVDGGQPADYLIEQIRQRHANSEVLRIKPEHAQQIRQSIAAIASSFATIIVVTTNANLDAYQGKLVQSLLHTGKPLIGLAIYNPYDLLAFPQLETYLVTYEYTPPALETAVRVLFGEIPPQGKLNP